VVIPSAEGRRFPIWASLIIFVLLAIFVITAGALRSAPKPAPLDNLLVRGSCVSVLENGDVGEAPCGGPHDAVVVTVVNFDGSCPSETETRRDRQGRGYACVTKVP
jgi:hypothetical protein